MVIICKDKFSENDTYNNHFQEFPFELSDFQKYAIKSIVEGDHILVTAHTGSGKTLPAEFAINYFVKNGKKVIYTSPIKALSNQKFHEFTKKFPHISFGILTGDIKFNPEADVLIMTTEILRNTLLQKTISETNGNINSPLQFEMDFKNELAAVVFDEVHYINDQDRGKVWEETIMFMPNHVQLIMLSATIDKSEIFAKWIEDVKTNDEFQKKVYLAPTNHRVVPLKHYFYTTMPQGPIKNIKDKEFLKFVNGFLHKPITVKEGNISFDKDNYNKISKLLTYIHKNNCHIKPSFVLNEVTKYLNSNNMLPAICFVFSRKLVEKYAQTINVSLFEEDSKIPSIIKHECEQILRKLSNHKEYINLPEFDMIIKLLEKGIAIHHSGIMPIFREMIELLFAKGYIKLLFATETFAVGINMPTKTVLFTGFQKFNGSSMRLLYSHEYTQMAGRAGRRGLDTVGYVIHLNNMFDLPYAHDYEKLLNGNPQLLQSKFSISYNLVLNFLQNNGNTLDFANKSMSNGELIRAVQSTRDIIDKLQNEFHEKNSSHSYQYVTSHSKEFSDYLQMCEDIKHAKQKTRKQLQRSIEDFEKTKNFKINLQYYKNLIEIENEIKDNIKYLSTLENHFNNEFNKVLDFLQENEYIETCDNNNNNDSSGDINIITDKNDGIINDKGKIACFIQETHCLAFTELLYKYNYFVDFNEYEIAALLSCFCNIRIKDDVKIYDVQNLTTNNSFNRMLCDLRNIYDDYMNKEIQLHMKENNDLEYLFELVNPILNWCESNDEMNCKQIIKTCEYEYEIFTGEFIKAILKINNMVNELSNIAEYTGNVELLNKLSLIPDITLKFIATNQSLYV